MGNFIQYIQLINDAEATDMTDRIYSNSTQLLHLLLSTAIIFLMLIQLLSRSHLLCIHHSDRITPPAALA